MLKRQMIGIRFRCLLAVLLILASSSVGCSSSSGSGMGGGGVAASFTPSATAAGANGVRLTGTPSGDMVTVQVMIGAPTLSSDLYSFAFDLVLGDETVAEYVSGSATVGTALTTSGGQSLQILAIQAGDRVAIGVTKLGGGAGNGIAGTAEVLVAEFTFQLLKVGTTSLSIEGAPGDDPAALDSGGSDIASVTFDAADATLTGI